MAPQLACLCLRAHTHTHSGPRELEPTGSREGEEEEKEGQPEFHSCATSILELIGSRGPGNADAPPPPTDTMAVPQPD